MRSHRNWLRSRVIFSLAAAAFAAGLALAGMACKKAAPVTAPPTPEVVVTEVIQRDVQLYSEWVGTTEGFVNAEIYPKISGYLVKQEYKDGDAVQVGQLLFQIDPRQYQAAFDQALGNLAQAQAELKQNQLNLARYTVLYKQAVISRQDFDNQANHTCDCGAGASRSGRGRDRQAQPGMDTGAIADQRRRRNRKDAGRRSGFTHSLLTTVSQLDPIKVEFPISEREYLHFAEQIKQHQEEGGRRTSQSSR